MLNKVEQSWTKLRKVKQSWTNCDKVEKMLKEIEKIWEKVEKKFNKVIPSHARRPSRSSPLPSQKTARLQTSRRPKVLFITDSIGSNADIRHLEEATNTLIYSEKAFGAAYKADAYNPNRNFNYVAMNAPRNRNYKYLVMQGSTTDITNLNTEDNFEYLKQEVSIASKNMITAARNALKTYPGIEKVLILDRIPRFDKSEADPLHLKSTLSDFGNTVYREEIKRLQLENKVFIANHSLPKHFQLNLYGHPNQSDFDGVHLRGPDGSNHYTRSICNILQNFLKEFSRDPHNHVIPSHKSSLPSARSPPTNVTDKPASVVINIEPENSNAEQNISYSIPTYNSFSILGN